MQSDVAIDPLAQPNVPVKTSSIKPNRNTAKVPVTNVYDIFVPLRENARAQFDETVDIVVKLGVDPRKPNQSIKGVARLPFGTGKQVKVGVFASGDDARIAQEAGADVVGAEDLIQKFQSGEVGMQLHTLISTPEMMSQVGKIGKVKSETITKHC